MALLPVWHSAVVDFGYVSSRILWTKFKFSRIKVFVAVGYGSNEGDSEEMDRFWNDMDRTLDSAGNGYRLWILGDLNVWIGMGFIDLEKAYDRINRESL